MSLSLDRYYFLYCCRWQWDPKRSPIWRPNHFPGNDFDVQWTVVLQGLQTADMLTEGLSCFTVVVDDQWDTEAELWLRLLYQCPSSVSEESLQVCKEKRTTLSGRTWNTSERNSSHKCNIPPRFYVVVINGWLWLLLGWWRWHAYKTWGSSRPIRLHGYDKNLCRPIITRVQSLRMLWLLYLGYLLCTMWCQ